MKHKLSRSSFTVRPETVSREYGRLVSIGAKVKLLPSIMTRRAALYSKTPALRDLIANRLGWVDVVDTMAGRADEVELFGRQALADGLDQIVVIGMGGSSLCPEVFKLIFGRRSGVTSIDILDSTDPSAVKAVADKLSLEHTLFIVASKSGGTVETRSHEAFFIGRLTEAGIPDIGRHFAAITDAGSDLESFAREHAYRHVFLNPVDIGGRYSALSFFGLVPGWFAGVDVKKLLGDARSCESILRERNDETNPALALGALMASAVHGGRDKLTFVSSKRTAPLVPWIEQLIAESTGKLGKGVVPIEGEPVTKLSEYGRDRLFAFVRLASDHDTALEKLHKVCERARIPSVEIVLGSKYELGRQFLMWEAAVAACGYYLKINPFDEPNVTESKNNTQAILKAFQSSGHFPQQRPQARWGKLSLVAVESTRQSGDKDCESLENVLRYLFLNQKPPQYVALLNYLESSRQTESALVKIRDVIRRRTGLATLRGYGPRFLHSIGQLYKGGPPNGVFIVLVREQYDSLPIPGRYFTFADLIRAQAIGDTQALVSRRLPVLVLGVAGRPATALTQLEQALKEALSKRKE